MGESRFDSEESRFLPRNAHVENGILPESCTTKRPGDSKIVGTFVWKRQMPRTFKVRGISFMLHCFFRHGPLCTANGFDLFHALLDRRFCEKRPLLELFQNTGPFVLLLESTNGSVDRFILSNDNSDQSNHLLRAAVSGRSNLHWDTLNNFGFS